MNIIVSSLLHNVLDYNNIDDSEKETFWLFISLMVNYKISDCFGG